MTVLKALLFLSLNAPPSYGVSGGPLNSPRRSIQLSFTNSNLLKSGTDQLLYQQRDIRTLHKSGIMSRWLLRPYTCDMHIKFHSHLERPTRVSI
ncbi:unnamed protein product [Leptidea sinapis]|uniref:Uncharacterized protein n=1 Tax=Leptidea sinapis TaxID=189913 RepID=A0A5E4Q7Q6_9NEOP|nr:unnamed protein product [Leptidea sinapis]